jgi:uracil-DNA glycosylase family 4
MNKNKKLLKSLVQERRNTKMTGVYKEYLNIGDVSPEFDNDNSGYEYCITPASKGACNPEVKVMVVLSDWISQEGIDKVNEAGLMESLIDNGRITTGIGLNKTCKSLSATARNNSNLDNKIINKHLGLRRQDVYITNAFPFVKRGDMRSKISNKVLNEASYFFKKQVEIIQPKLVLVLGDAAKKVFNVCFKISTTELDDNTSVLVSDKFTLTVSFMPHPSIYNQNKGVWAGERFDKNRIIMSIINGDGTL